MVFLRGQLFVSEIKHGAVDVTDVPGYFSLCARAGGDSLLWAGCALGESRSEQAPGRRVQLHCLLFGLPRLPTPLVASYAAWRQTLTAGQQSRGSRSVSSTWSKMGSVSGEDAVGPRHDVEEGSVSEEKSSHPRNTTASHQTKPKLTGLKAMKQLRFEQPPAFLSTTRVRHEKEFGETKAPLQQPVGLGTLMPSTFPSILRSETRADRRRLTLAYCWVTRGKGVTKGERQFIRGSKSRGRDGKKEWVGRSRSGGWSRRGIYIDLHLRPQVRL